jgi:electron transfer flavoprotein alpha subunit
MILVIAEQQNGKLNRASWEPIVAAQQTGQPVMVAILGQDVATAADELAAADVSEVVRLEHPALASYTADGYTAALAGFIGAEQPGQVFLTHTYQTRDFAPKLAARLDRALLTDCVGMTHHDGSVVFVRPMFQAKVYAEVAADGPPPHFITFQIGAIKSDRLRKGASPATVRRVEIALDAAAIRQKPEPPFQEARQAVDLTQAERIVAVGRGIKAPEHLAVAEKLAKALRAELAASRPVCDAGWLPMDRQIGSSGQTVAPRLYVALGISGAIQHLVGMKGARTIVAVNKDPEAPIFEIADFGIAADLFEIVPAIVAEMEKSSGA